MPSVQRRTLSFGETQELKRLQAYSARKAMQNPNTGHKPNRNTMAFKPPRTDYYSLNLAPDNKDV
jgi:hypothetical protein